ncbi:MAG: carbohydrate kinase family protein, partial [Desulfobacterales bacterium]|nr:carbohydrate kinase family protein [Desulfobacterales bacterium]
YSDSGRSPAALTAAMFLVAGDLNIDVTTTAPLLSSFGKEAPAGITLSFGGQGGNVAYFLRCLGEPVRLIGALGRDEAGHLYRRRLEALGITFDGWTDETPTGMVSVVQEAGGYHMYRQRGANAVPDAGRFEAFLTAALAASSKEPTCLFVSGYTLPGAGYAEVLTRRLANRPASRLVTAMDPASVEAMREAGRDVVLETAHLFDWFLPNQEEAAWLAGSADPAVSAGTLSRLTGHSTVVKRGAMGAVMCHRGQAIEVDGVHIPEVDVTGAGDAFAAAFLSSLVAHQDPTAALATAVHFSAAKVALSGSQPESLRGLAL